MKALRLLTAVAIAASAYSCAVPAEYGADDGAESFLILESTGVGCTVDSTGRLVESKGFA